MLFRTCASRSPRFRDQRSTGSRRRTSSASRSLGFGFQPLSCRLDREELVPELGGAMTLQLERGLVAELGERLGAELGDLLLGLKVIGTSYLGRRPAYIRPGAGSRRIERGRDPSPTFH